MQSISNRRLLWICRACVLIILLQCQQSLAQQTDYAKLLETVFEKAGTARGDIQLLTPETGWNPPGPRFTPLRGFDEPNAVPFLIGVLQQGPQWSNEELLKKRGGIYPHIARCCAALCLGGIGDTRAFGPLLETLQSGSYLPSDNTIPNRWGNKYDIRRYAAFALGELGDRRAVKPLIVALKKDKWPECIYALMRLQAVQAAQPIIEVASEQGIFYAEVHRALQYMLRTGFDIERGETGYRIIEFPQLGEINSRDINKKLWQYWLKVGPEYTKKQFDKYYAELKVAQKEDPNDRSRHRYLQRQMLKGGVATLPYLMEKIEQGDESMMSSMYQLVRKRPPQRSQQDIDKLEQTFQDRNKCLNWWKQNKKEWILFSRINR